MSVLTYPFYLSSRRTSLLFIRSAVFLIACSLPSLVWAQKALTDTLSSGSSNWTSIKGDWAVTAGGYNSNGIPPDAIAMLTAPDSTSYQDFTLSYDEKNANESGVVLHSDATGANALCFVINARNPNAYFILREGNKFTRFLSVTPLPDRDKEGSNYHVTITATGNSYTAVVSLGTTSDAPIGTVRLVNDPGAAKYSSGYLGVYEYGATRNVDGSILHLTRFSNFTVSPAAKP